MLQEMNVCDNLGEHMIGNVYVKFRREEDASKAADLLNNRCVLRESMMTKSLFACLSNADRMEVRY